MGGLPPERALADPGSGAGGQGVLTLPRALLGRLRRELDAGAGLILILDYDGTLTPIVPSPEAARLAPSVRRTLEALARNPRVRLAILSGRSLRDVRRRVGVRRAVYGGCHGLEVAGAGLRFRHAGAAARARAGRLKQAARALAGRLRRFPGAFLELKGLSVSLHYRRVSRSRRRELLSLARRVERRTPGLTRLSGKDVFEFVPRVNWGKGQAVTWVARRLARSLAPSRGVVLYAGDDATDAAAFAALRGRGLTVRVGPGRGRAQYAAGSVRALHALLRWIARAIRRGEPGGRGSPGGAG